MCIKNTVKAAREKLMLKTQGSWPQLNCPAILQWQSAVTTHLVKIELRLVMGFMTCVLSCEKISGLNCPVSEMHYHILPITCLTGLDKNFTALFLHFFVCVVTALCLCRAVNQTLISIMMTSHQLFYTLFKIAYLSFYCFNMAAGAASHWTILKGFFFFIEGILS